MATATLPAGPDKPLALEVRPTSDSHFSWLRTRLSMERTLLSWLRTAVSMIGFGFTIVQFFERFHDMQGVQQAMRPGAPRYLGLMLIGTGTLALLISTWQYHAQISYLWSDTYRVITPKHHRMTPAYVISIVMICVGVFAFSAVFMRMT